MRHLLLRTVAAIAGLPLLLLGPLTPARASNSAWHATAPAATAEAPRAATALDALPLAFEENVGQTDARARFVARGRGYTVFLTDEGPVLSLAAELPSGPDASPTDVARTPKPREAVRMRLAGARATARVRGERELPGRSNYLAGADASRWRRDVPTYGAVRYEGVYRGVDAVFHGAERQLEYDFVVAPGADPSQIRVRFEGPKGARVDDRGDLVLELAGGELRQQRAVVYQEGASGKRAVPARYVLRGSDEVGFEVGDYDRTRPLVVDPIVFYASYLGGGASHDEVHAVAVDGSGAAFVTGVTDALDFPTTSGAFDEQGSTAVPYYGYAPDAFVAKIAADGSSLVYSTYLGGTSVDEGTALAVDASGGAYVAGTTWSSNFPTTPGAFDTTPGINAPDAFVARLSSDGSSLVYSTLFGGSRDDRAVAIAVDVSGTAYVAGATQSYDMPTTSAAFDVSFNSLGQEDAFVASVNPSGTALGFSSFLGGFGTDIANDVAVDGSGAVYVAGYTQSTPDFPVTAGAYDTTTTGDGYDIQAFVTKFAPGGATLAYSTFLGGDGDDRAASVAVDASGAAYVAGSTSSSNYPVTPGALDSSGYFYYTDVFVTKLDATGSGLGYSATIGGENFESATSIAVDASGAAYLTGSTRSTDFPTTVGAFDTTLDGTDAFVSKVNAGATALVYSTLVGGAGEDHAQAIAVDAAGAAYAVGDTTSIDFPTTPGAFERRAGGGTDGFVTKLDASGAPAYSAYVSGGASIGATTEDEATGVAVDATGAIVVVGWTQSLNFPTTTGAYDPTPTQPSYYSQTDAFVAKIGPGATSLVYATFLGGVQSDRALGVALDASGGACVTGSTSSPDFPTTAGAFDETYNSQNGYGGDAFVAKLAANGNSLAYSTFLGGTSDDVGSAIAVDGSGAAYVTGETSSAEYPTTPGALDTIYNGYGNADVFVTEVAPDGASLSYSTYLGGGGDDTGRGIAVDGAGAAYITGDTLSPSFPTTAGAFDTTFNGYSSGAADAFVAKLAPGGASLVYGTLLGGLYQETAYGIAVDSSGSAYAVGTTYSTDYPTTPGAFNPGGGTVYTAGYVTKLDAAGATLPYSTYLDGENADEVRAVHVDATGRAYVTGWTTSASFPTTPGALDEIFGDGAAYESDAFLTVFDAAGGALAYSTFLGGGRSDVGSALAVDGSGVAYVAGTTASRDFATSGFGSRDQSTAFVAAVQPAGAPSADTPGIYVGESAGWFLKNASAEGASDLSFTYGPAGSAWLPVVGDWNGDGADTPGLFDPATGTYYLRNANAGGNADATFTFGGGGEGIVPLGGDWDGDGDDTIGFYVASTGTFFLRNTNSGGGADLVVTFGAGGVGFIPLTGDWDGDGDDTIGLYDPATGAFFLKNTNAPGGADLVFYFGAGGGTPIRGDWNGDGVDTVGLYDGYYAAWLLKNTNTPGGADLQFGYGAQYAVPVIGNWDGQ